MNHITAKNFNSFDGVPYLNRLIENYSPNESKYVRCADVYEAYLGCDKENCPDVSTVTLGRVPKTTNENAIL